MMTLFLIVLVFFHVSRVVTSDSAVNTESGPDFTQDERYKLGQAKYEAIKRESRGALPKYSTCWTNALERLESGCKELTDDIQHRLALLFTNCFLDKNGRPTYECASGLPVRECTKDMTSEAFNTYSEFFTHTQNICFFLQGQVWQSETEATISKLSDNSQLVAQQMEDSSNLQAEVLRRQNESIKNQEVLMLAGSELRKTIDESTSGVQNIMADFKKTTGEQRQLIFEVFDRVSSLQSLVMGEFTGFYSLIFYAISILIAYLLTSTPRTSDARFWLFVLMTGNIIAERMIVYWTAESEDINDNSLLYARLWSCRKLFTTVAVFLWALSAYRYCDYNKINNQLLVTIQRQNSEMKRMLQEAQTPAAKPEAAAGSYMGSRLQRIASSLSQLSTGRHVPEDHVDSPSMEDREDKAEDHSSTTGYETDSNSSLESSLNSERSDRTFVYTGDISDSESESYASIHSSSYSRESTPVLREEVKFLREATPNRELQETGAASPFITPNSRSGLSGKRGRPKGSKSTPRPHVLQPCRYNLRNRKSDGLQRENPIVQEESALDFGRMIRHLSGISSRNHLKAKVVVQKLQQTPAAGDSPRPSTNFFSSDED